jgi:hypothetical protein
MMEVPRTDLLDLGDDLFGGLKDRPFARRQPSDPNNIAGHCVRDDGPGQPKGFAQFVREAGFVAMKAQDRDSHWRLGDREIRPLQGPTRMRISH